MTPKQIERALAALDALADVAKHADPPLSALARDCAARLRVAAHRTGRRERNNARIELNVALALCAVGESVAPRIRAARARLNRWEAFTGERAPLPSAPKRTAAQRAAAMDARERDMTPVKRSIRERVREAADPALPAPGGADNG